MFAAGDVLGKLEAFRAGLASGDAKRRAAPPKPGKGDRVTAKISGWKQPYKGTVESVDKDTRACRVVFDDGEVVDAVHFDEILAVDSKGNVKDGAKSPSLGDYVSARVAGWKKPYSGTITKVVEEDEVFEITFDDGEVIDDVRLEEILEVLTRATPVKSKVNGSLQVGTRVQAQVSGWKKPYQGVITRIVQPNKVFEVTFDDGEVIEDVQVNEILQCFAEDKLLAQGTRVMAKLKGWKQAYPGVIKAVKNGAYNIVFDDGEVQEGVEPSIIEDVLEDEEEDGDDLKNGDLLDEGTRVTAKLKGWKQPYPGVIKAVKNGAYKIVFDDGEVQEGVEPSAVEDVLEEEKEELLAQGTRVTAKLEGWKQAYPGVIKAVKNGSYKIVFDDGEVQEDVEPFAIKEVLENEDEEGDEVEMGDVLAEGTRVTAKLKGWKQAYPGVIKAVKNGAYKIVFDDGEVQESVNPSAVEDVLKDEEETSKLLTEGTRVTAKLKGWKQAYPGVIKAVKNGAYKIVFDDGEVQEGVEPSAVEDVLEKEEEKEVGDLHAEGTRVTAKLKGWKQAYPGTIKAVKNGAYKIVFDDGEVQENVESSAIEAVFKDDNEEEEEEEEEVGKLLTKGTRVTAKLKGWKQAYPGVIKAVKNGTYKIVFDDDEVQEGVEASAVKDVLKDEEKPSNLLAEGTRVTAKLKGWKQAYPGVIKAIKNGAYKIVFDDGEVQEGVEPSAIEDVLDEEEDEEEDDDEGEGDKEEEIGDLLTEGTRVTAKLKGWKQAYPGVIKAVKNGAYKIVFDDGEIQEGVEPSAIEDVLNDEEEPIDLLAEGTRVTAKLKGWKQAYPGVIKAVKSGAYKIEFDDGEVCESVQPAEILVHEVEQASESTRGDLAPGERIRAKLQSWKEAYSGTIRNVNGDGTLHVEFDDGEVIKSLSLCDLVNEPSPRRPTDIANDEDLLAFLNDEKEILEVPADSSTADNNLSQGGAQVTKPASTSVEGNESSPLGVVPKSKPGDLEMASRSKESVTLNPAPGDTVMAKLSSWKTAYKGVVKRHNVQDGSFKVVFDDGEVVNAVPKSAITEIVTKKMASSDASNQPSFSAPDGKTFHDRAEYKRYMYETYYCFKQAEGNHTTLVKVPGSVDGQPFDLASLSDCMVRVLCWSSQVQVDKVIKSKVFIGPCESSIFIRDCRDCEFTLACRQLRLRDCENCTFNLFSNVDPVIETSTNLVFRPFNGAYAGLREHFAKAKLDPADNHWRQIFDFNKDGCDGYGIPDPHYRLEEAKSNKLVWEWVESDFEGPGECVNPVAPDAVATTQSDGGATHQGQFTEAGAAAGRTEEGPCFVWASKISRDKLTIGTRVSVNFNRDSKKPRASDFYQGKIQACNSDGTFVVAYDDGDVENDCKIDFIKVAQTTKAPVTSGLSGLEDNKDSAADFPAVAPPQKNDQTSSYSKPSAPECQDSKPRASTQAKGTNAETSEALSSSDAKIGGAASLNAAISSSNSLNATFTWAKDVSDQLLMTGAVVRVNFNRGSQDPTDEDFYTGKIRRINDDGSFAIDYDDGDVEEDCKLDFVQLLTGHAESISNRVQQETPKHNDLAEMTIDAPSLRKEKPVVLHQMMTFDAVERKNKKKGASSDVVPPQERQPKKASSSSARIHHGGSLSLRQARDVDEAVQSESVLVNQNPHEEYVDLSALCKGVVNAVHSDETLEVELDNAETIDGVQLHQVYLLDGAMPTPRAARRTVQQRTRRDPEDNAFTLLRLELSKLREEQRVDQVRMRKERKAQEARILEQRRKQAESLAASRSQARQSVLIKTMQREIGAQREFQQQLLLQHQEAMEKLQHRLVDLTAETEGGLSPRLGSTKKIPPGRTDVGGEQLASLAELEAIRQEIQESRVALQQDMRAAASHAREMERLTREKELERGWNAGRGRQAKSSKAPKATPEVVTSLATDGIEAEVIADAMNELEEAKKQRADFLVAMKRRLRKQKSDARTSQANASLRMAACRADANRAVKLLYGLYEGYESERSGKVVRSPGPSEIVTPQWTQKVTELQLKPLNFRSRAHNDETWREVGLALARIHVEGLGLAENARSSAQQQAIPQLKKAWIDWTIASNKDLQGIRVSAALARKLGIIDSSLEARSGGGGDGDEDDVVFDGLLFTHRQCERRVLKHSRQEQRGDFARAHIVPDVPLDPEVRLQNSLYKKVCRDEWAQFVQRVEAKDDYLNRTPGQTSGPDSTKEALQLLQTWAKADHEAKQAEASRRAAERKAEAARDFEQWKQLKEKSRVKTRTLEQLRDAKAERKTPFPRPAGGPSDLAAAFASERALPLRYAGNGRALEGEANTNYMHAAQRTSLPGSGPLVQALKAKSAGSKGSVYASRSHDPQNPWKNVASTEHELRQFDALLAAQEDAEKERAVQAQRDFLAWEDAVKVEKRVTDALKALDFEGRCMRTSLNTSTPETRLGMDEWIFVGRALHALHHAQSRSLFQTWAEWTVQGVKSVLNKPLLTFTRCTLEVIEGGATGLRLEPNVRLAEGAMLWITRSPASRPGGKLTPEGLAVQVDRKSGDLAVVGASLASSTDKTTTSLVHCAWQKVTMVPGATVYVYPIPSLLGRVMFGSNSSGRGSLSVRGAGPHAGRLRDSHQLSGHVRSICAEKWRTFTPNMRWFSDLLSEDDEDLLCGEVDKFRQLRQNERMRAKLLEIAGEHSLAAEIHARMHVLWAMVLQNPALASSTVLFQEIGGSPASMARIDSRGHEIDATGDDAPSIASVCKNDLVCLASQDKNVRSRWHKGAYWYRIVGLSMVKHSVVVVREPKIRSAGDGALAFRISLSGLHDDTDDVAKAVEDDLPVEETVHLSRLSGAILVRPQRGEVKEDTAFDMYLLPEAGVFARSMGAEMIARAEADAKTARCKEQEAEASSKMALQENGENSYESFRNALLEQLAPASDEAVSQHFDFVGKSLARVASSWRRVGVVPRSIKPAVAAGAEETKDETECGTSLVDGGQCPWLQLWRSWVLSSQKWAELARLGFQLSDMHAMMDRKWVKFSDTSKQPGSRDPLGTSMLVLNDLRAQLESSQIAATSAILSSSSSSA